MSRFGAVGRKVGDPEKAVQIAMIGVRDQMKAPPTRENVKSVNFDEEHGDWYVTFESGGKTVVVKIDSMMGSVLDIKSN